MNNYIKSYFEKEENSLKEIQTHNFNQYLRSICNLKGRVIYFT